MRGKKYLDMSEKKYSDDDLAVIWAQLFRLADILIGKKKRPLKAAGKTPEDYVQEAFTKFLENEEKYDPARGSLSGYIMNQFLRSLIADDFKTRKRDKKIKGHHEFHDREELLETAYLINAYLDEQMDFDQIIPQIVDVLKSDPTTLAVYNGRYLDQKKFDEICNEHGLSKEEAYNAVRRINRVLEEIIEKNDLEDGYGKRK
jgi:DNA-directed RNA polymerase specialized sigma24 family protein